MQSVNAVGRCAGLYQLKDGQILGIQIAFSKVSIRRMDHIVGDLHHRCNRIRGELQYAA